MDRFTYPSSINEKGEIAGSYHDFAGGAHGFVRAPGGTITTFDVPGSSTTGASSINDEGTITGSYSDTLRLSHGFIRDPEGNFTTFDAPDSIGTVPGSINAGGAVTGYYQDLKNVSHGFVRRANGKLISFDPPGSISTMAFSINAKGDITGSYRDANQLSHFFVRRSGGEIVSFDPPNGSPSVDLANRFSQTSINNAGVITGSYQGTNGRAFGFVRDRHGKFTSFDIFDPPENDTWPRSINDEGAITGYFEPDLAELNAHAFVRSPEGTITSFNPPFCVSQVRTFAQSINDEGVITGSCDAISPSGTVFNLAWVRFP